MGNALQRVCAYQTPNSFGGEGFPTATVFATKNGRRHPCGRFNDDYRHASTAAKTATTEPNVRGR